MPETRTYHNDDDSEIGKLVRSAIGENIRPFEAGDPTKYRSAEELDAEAEAEAEQREAEGPNSLAAALGTWDWDEDETWTQDK